MSRLEELIQKLCPDGVEYTAGICLQKTLRLRLSLIHISEPTRPY